MSKIAICGGQKLNGEVIAQGSKNAALPILAATVLNDEECVLLNCPELEDVRAALKIIDWLGGDTQYFGHSAVINSKDIHKQKIPEELMNSMRSSVLF